jgi:hypothetical protein
MWRNFVLASLVLLLAGRSGAVVAAPPVPTAARTMRVVVLDPQEKPLSNANVHVSIWTDEKDFKANRGYTTDAAGAARVELPKTYDILRVWATAVSEPDWWHRFQRGPIDRPQGGARLASGDGPRRPGWTGGLS